MPTRPLARALALGATLAMLSTGIAAATIPGGAALPDDALAARRYAGADRYETAALTALRANPDGAMTAIIARGDAFPDGLAASYLAGVEGAPILLTAPTTLPAATLDGLDQLGAQRAIIVGGVAAIDQSVEDALARRLGEGNVDRIDGSNRYETAAFIYNEAGTLGTLRDLSGASDRQLRTAVVASGRSFPDALAAGPLAAAAGVPILLTEPDTLPQITRVAIESGVQQVLVAGGSATVSSRVLAQLREIGGVEVVERVAGPDRTATAARLAAVTRDLLGWSRQAVTVALGTDFPDALTLAPAAARLRAPILLARSTGDVGPETFVAVQADCDPIRTLVISGGIAAIDASAERQLELATSCDDLTTALEADAVAGGGDAEARGTAWVWTQSLCYAVRVRDLTSPATRAHVHGPVSASLDVPSPTTGDGFAVGCLTDDDVSDGTAADLRAALEDDPTAFDVDVHSEAHPDGALRGQLG